MWTETTTQLQSAADLEQDNKAKKWFYIYQLLKSDFQLPDLNLAINLLT